MDERLRFVAKLLDGESMSGLCREFGISRKTGYKIFNRYKESGFEALSDRSSATGALRQPAAAADREPDRQPQAREAALGRAQDSRAAGAPFGPGRSHPGQEHHPRRFAPARPGQGNPPASLAGDRYRALRRRSGQRFMVRRLQGRVQARQRPVLLSPHRHRPRFPLPAPVRSARINARRHCDHRLRATIPRARPAVSHPLRQRRTVRQPQCAVQPVQAFRLVAASGHCDRAHQARPSTAKRTS